ncbi:MAG: thermonuclease family protein [Proteobacteria bacterium]|nr:thermonuclease family protein [Pseudomonadota bacterium]
MFFKFLVLPVLVLVGVAFFLLQSRDNPGVEGAGKVVNGRTMVIKAQRVRLHGIDAPDLRQTCTVGGKSYPCGKEAAAFLARLVGPSRLHCEQMDRSNDGHMLAICSLRGEIINRKLVESGWAVASGPDSDDYVPLEEAARKAKKGLWQGEFELPWEWRAKKR